MSYKEQHAWNDARFIGSFAKASIIATMDKAYVAEADDQYFNTTLNELRKYDATYGWRPVPGQGGASTRCTFDRSPLLQTEGGGAAADTDNLINVWQVGGERFTATNVNAQTLFAPTQTAAGLNIAMDETATDGFEINQGIIAGTKHAYTVGTTAAFHMQATVDIGDVSDITTCYMGFRKVEAHQNSANSYDECASIGYKAAALTIMSTINNTTTETDTTDVATDNTVYTFRVNVSAAGVVTYTINGSAPTTVLAFTFDTGENVIPFFHLVNGGTIVDCVISDWEVGLDD